MKDIILLTISGVGKPSTLSKIMDIVASYPVNILDIKQALIHNSLSLGIKIELLNPSESSALLDDMECTLGEMDMTLKYQPISEAEYQSWVAEQANSRHVISLMSRSVTASQIAAVAEILASQGIEVVNITRLSAPVCQPSATSNTKACVEFIVQSVPIDTRSIRQTLFEAANDLDVDIILQEDSILRRNRRVAVFDMDSTLIEAEVIDELAKEAGIGDKVIAITESAMRGEIDFDESFRRRVALLKGLKSSVLERIAQRLPITEGLDELMSNLKTLGYKTAILSGGFTYFAEHLQRKFGFDYIHANVLDIHDGEVTGKVVGDIVNGQRKAEFLKEIAAKEGVSLEQTIAVGDGANDLPMLETAGLGIAFRAKPLVKERAQHSISVLGLDGILYLIGVSDKEALDK